MLDSIKGKNGPGAGWVNVCKLLLSYKVKKGVTSKKCMV